MDKLVAMQVFVQIVDHGSLTGAAQHLDRSLPTIVRTLANLETTLGAQLIRRTTRTMSVTPEGQRYLRHCRQILADVAEAENGLRDDGGELQGEVRMTAPVLFGTRYVVPAISKFLIEHPQIHVDLLLADNISDIVDEGIDLALRIGVLPDSAMVATPLGEMRRVVCASPGLIEQYQVAHPRDLSQVPCIRFRRESTGSTWHFQTDGRELSVQVSGPLTCNQTAAAADACADGIGFGQFLAYQVEPYIRAGALVITLDNFERAPLAVSLIRSGGRSLAPRLRVLSDWLKQALKDAWVHS